jgi:hypothetical protein
MQASSSTAKRVGMLVFFIVMKIDCFYAKLQNSWDEEMIYIKKKKVFLHNRQRKRYFMA